MIDLGLPADGTGTMVTVGTFDGFHLGHRDVVSRLVSAASAARLPSVLLTFEPHPLAVVRPEAAPPLLTPGAERLEALASAGLDRVVVLPFTRALASLTAERFVNEVLLERLGMHRLMIGHDHGFGRGRAGDVETLRSIGQSRGFEVEVVPPVADHDGQPISSTIVRRAVTAGDLETAARLLGSPYGSVGQVIHGQQRGRSLGFRTLNVSLPDSRKLLPPLGVYAVRVWTPDGLFGGMLNLGARPTFGISEVGLEAHLFDADGDWYGATVRLEFLARLRAVRRFDSPAELRAQLTMDEQEARRALTRFDQSGNLSSSALF